MKNDVIYTCTVSSLNEIVTVDIDSKDLIYVDGISHEGLQCNHSGESDEHKEILSLCNIINDAFKRIYKINKI